MLKISVNLWICDEEKEQRGLYLQKDLEVNFVPAIGMNFEPKLWTDELMKNSVLVYNKNRYLKFKIVDLLWSEINASDLSVDIEGQVSSRALDFIWKNLDEIEDKTNWEYTGFPINPDEYFNNFCR